MRNKKLFAVIGCPVAHSLSPAMQNAGFRAAGIDAEYFAVEVEPPALGAFTEKARTRLAGFNITVPHKSAVIPFLDSVDPRAFAADSVNTVAVEGGRLSGTSTDGNGLEAALAEAFSFSPAGKSITFIGCGGVVKALSFHFAAKGAKHLHLLNRTLSTAETLASLLKSRFPSTEIACAPLSDTGKTEDFLNASELALQCTSLGLKESDPPPVNPLLLPAGILFYDTIYRKTILLDYAESHGIRCSNGLSMLLHQGARSFSIWTGTEAPLEAMRNALNEAFLTR